MLGFIDPEDEDNTRHLKRIKSVLARRGLKADFKNDTWIIHGPHQDMNYQVLIGWAYPKDSKDCKEEERVAVVAIYPWACYWIGDNEDDWGKVSNDNRMWVEGGWEDWLW